VYSKSSQLFQAASQQDTRLRRLTLRLPRFPSDVVHMSCTARPVTWNEISTSADVFICNTTSLWHTMNSRARNAAVRPRSTLFRKIRMWKVRIAIPRRSHQHHFRATYVGRACTHSTKSSAASFEGVMVRMPCDEIFRSILAMYLK